MCMVVGKGCFIGCLGPVDFLPLGFVGTEEIHTSNKNLAAQLATFSSALRYTPALLLCLSSSLLFYNPPFSPPLPGLTNYSFTCFIFLVMDITDIIKGKAESDEEKQHFIPFHP